MIERDAPFRALSRNQSIDQPQGSVSGYDDDYATDHVGYDLLWDPWTAQTAVSALSPLFHTSCQEETLRAARPARARAVRGVQPGLWNNRSHAHVYPAISSVMTVKSASLQAPNEVDCASNPTRAYLKIA